MSQFQPGLRYSQYEPIPCKMWFFIGTFVLISFIFKTMATKTFADRIEELRKLKGLSQVELADKIKISKSQMNRYINHGVEPPADVLKGFAEHLGTTVDYLLYGKTDEKAKETLKSNELLSTLKEIDSMPTKEQNLLLHYIQVYLRDYKARVAYTS